MIKCSECRKSPTTTLTIDPRYCGHTHYSISSLDSIEDIKNFFPDGKANELNWFICSTSGVHGTYTTLDDIEKGWDITDENDENYSSRSLTVQIILPRMVRIIYGVIDVNTKEDIAYLRGLVSSSLEEITKTQVGNISSQA